MRTQRCLTPEAPRRIRNWQQALKHNRVVNPIDRLERDASDSDVAYVMRAAGTGTPFSAASKGEALPFIRFIKREQKQRWRRWTTTGFEKVATLRHADPEYFYMPRYSDLEYIFGGEAREIGFFQKRGLDVGCRSMMDPHYLRYSQHFQMEMFGVDIFLDPALQNEQVVIGDVRNLPFANDYFDFATVAMIFGFGRPSDTILEIAVGLSELHRTVKGFVYLADRYVMPEVVFVAQQLGFRTLVVNMGSSSLAINGIFPMGTFLVKNTIVMPHLIAQLLATGKEIPFSPPKEDLYLPRRRLR